MLPGTVPPLRQEGCGQFCYLLLVFIESLSIQLCYLVSNKINGCFHLVLETWFLEQLFAWHHLSAAWSPTGSLQSVGGEPHMSESLTDMCSPGDTWAASEPALGSSLAAWSISLVSKTTMCWYPAIWVDIPNAIYFESQPWDCSVDQFLKILEADMNPNSWI